MPSRQLPPAVRRAVGARVKMIREARQMSQAALARRVGSDPSMVARLESGDRLPDLGHILAVARELGVPVGYVLEGKGELPELTPVEPEDADRRFRRTR